MFRVAGFRQLSKVIDKTLQGQWHNHLLKSSSLQIQTQRKYAETLAERTGTKGRVPTEAQIVVCGGGVVGCSVAYHLALEGWKDIILLEQGR